MGARKPQGTVIIFYETDLEQAKPFDEETLSDIQKQVLSKLSEGEQEKIRKGYAASATDLESGETICQFNVEGYRPPQSNIDRFVEAIALELKSSTPKKKTEKHLKNGEQNRKTRNNT